MISKAKIAQIHVAKKELDWSEEVYRNAIFHPLRCRMARELPGKISFIKPMHAVPVRTLPEGPDWLYEIKFDGYRCIAGKDSSGVSLWSRRGNDFTS